MIFWFSLPFAIAEECPTHDLYAHKLDAYTIEVGDEQVQFRLLVDKEEVIEPEVELWTSILQACRAEQTLEQVCRMAELPGRIDKIWEWRIKLQDGDVKWRLRRDIRHLERETVIQYAQMLPIKIGDGDFGTLECR